MWYYAHRPLGQGLSYMIWMVSTTLVLYMYTEAPHEVSTPGDLQLDTKQEERCRTASRAYSIWPTFHGVVDSVTARLAERR